MNHSLVDNPPVLEVLDDDALEQRGRDRTVPDALRVHNDNRPAGADAQTWRLATLDAARAEQQPFTLEKLRQKGVECMTSAIGRAEAARAHQHMSRVRLHDDAGVERLTTDGKIRATRRTA